MNYNGIGWAFNLVAASLIGVGGHSVYDAMHHQTEMPRNEGLKVTVLLNDAQEATIRSCEDKLARNQPCTADETKAYAAVKQNDARAKMGVLSVLFGSSLMLGGVIIAAGSSANPRRENKDKLAAPKA
jgi:hypothetical protein